MAIHFDDPEFDEDDRALRAREVRDAELDREFDRLDAALAAGQVDPERHFAGYQDLFRERAAGRTFEDELVEQDRLDDWYRETGDY